MHIFSVINRNIQVTFKVLPEKKNRNPEFCFFAIHEENIAVGHARRIRMIEKPNCK